MVQNITLTFSDRTRTRKCVLKIHFPIKMRLHTSFVNKRGTILYAHAHPLSSLSRGINNNSCFPNLKIIFHT